MSEEMKAAPLLAEISRLERREGNGGEDRFSYVKELASAHNRFGTDRQGPVRSILNLIGDKWSTLIIQVLGSSEFRYTTLRELVALLSDDRQVSNRVLALELRKLQREGLVARKVWPTIPPRVDYSLTPLGRSLLLQIESLVAWTQDNFEAIVSARAAFDQEAPPEG
jgi:DNA-binding HxlR family transcriptional regulator